MHKTMRDTSIMIGKFAVFIFFVLFIYLSNKDYTNRIVCVQKNTEHTEQRPNCRGVLSWDPESEEQRGYAWRERVICNSCTYQSRMYSLYTEAESMHGRRGRRQANINTAIQVGLSQAPIGNAAVRRLLLAANIPAPSEKGMQDASNKVAEHIVKENVSDMTRRSARIITINEARGEPSNIIDVQGDATYNNSPYGNVGKTPFQAGTQAIYMYAEDNTSKHEIVGAVIKNKLSIKIIPIWKKSRLVLVRPTSH